MHHVLISFVTLSSMPMFDSTWIFLKRKLLCKNIRQSLSLMRKRDNAIQNRRLIFVCEDSLYFNIQEIIYFIHWFVSHSTKKQAGDQSVQILLKLLHQIPSNLMNELTIKWVPCQQPKLTTNFPCHNIHVYSISVLYLCIFICCNTYGQYFSCSTRR